MKRLERLYGVSWSGGNHLFFDRSSAGSKKRVIRVVSVYENPRRFAGLPGSAAREVFGHVDRVPAGIVGAGSADDGSAAGCVICRAAFGTREAAARPLTRTRSEWSMALERLVEPTTRSDPASPPLDLLEHPAPA